jgi:hypothetical protein
MNDRSTNTPPDDDGPPERDGLDDLLRAWHDENRAAAMAGRDRTLEALRADRTDRPPVIAVIRRTVMNRYSPLAAAAAVLLLVFAYAFLPSPGGGEAFAGVIMAPDGGRLDAFDEKGNALGPCELKHTDVKAEISGRLIRVGIEQVYRNPHADKIEAVYTFPMSHRAAVDRMRMRIGDRVVEGEVKERQQARRIYEAARAQGRIASLLEQERPNIFTQSVANIEPGAEIVIEISYVETLEHSEGLYSFEFPTVVGPRYIPGSPLRSQQVTLPEGFEEGRGLVLLMPGEVSITETPEDLAEGESLTAARLFAILRQAVPVRPMAGLTDEALAPLRHAFTVAYPDGSAEPGIILRDGTGQVGGRWFFADPARLPTDAGGYAQDTDQVPDASRITPMPVRPETRAGHDIAISVTLDTGGPAITDIQTPLHETEETWLFVPNDFTRRDRVQVTLKDRADIPNRDFVLSWRVEDDAIEDSVLAHNGPHGGFFSVALEPPARVADEAAVPRELVFVLDSSGSMSGFPIEKAKETMARLVDQMRPRDTFNVITFAGNTRILWDTPRPGSQANIEEAQKFLAGQSGSGGTEMMKAIRAALERRAPNRPDAITVRELADLPADAREVTVAVETSKIDRSGGGQLWRIDAGDGISIAIPLISLPGSLETTLVHHGTWETVDGERLFRIASTTYQHGPMPQSMRIVCFMTDGYVGNDMAIVDEIHKNRAGTRVFAFGIGNSVNRYLLDNMAIAGGGEVEYVLIESDADAAADRFIRRISSPVLANIEVEFSDGLSVVDVLPDPSGYLPDLYDQKPLTIIGRYTAPGTGTVTIRGVTGAGPFERTLDLDLPATDPSNDVLATLWARTKIDEVMSRDLKGVQEGTLAPELRAEIVTLGETFSILSQYTSFVAVDKLSVTLGGEPRLVRIPIELPDRVSWEGNFGGSVRLRDCPPPKPADPADIVPRIEIEPMPLELGEMLPPAMESDQLGRTADLIASLERQAAGSEIVDQEMIRDAYTAVGEDRWDRPMVFWTDSDDAAPADTAFGISPDATMEGVAIERKLMLADEPTAGYAFALQPTPITQNGMVGSTTVEGRIQLGQGVHIITGDAGEPGVAGDTVWTRPTTGSVRLRSAPTESAGAPGAGTAVLAEARTAGRSMRRMEQASQERVPMRGVAPATATPPPPPTEEPVAENEIHLGAKVELVEKLLKSGAADQFVPVSDESAGVSLAREIPYDFDDNTLADILRFFQTITQVRFLADWDALAPLGVTPETTVTLKSEASTVADALDAVLEAAAQEALGVREVGEEEEDGGGEKPAWRLIGSRVIISAEALLPSAEQLAQAAKRREQLRALWATVASTRPEVVVTWVADLHRQDRTAEARMLAETLRFVWSGYSKADRLCDVFDETEPEVRQAKLDEYAQEARTTLVNEARALLLANRLAEPLLKLTEMRGLPDELIAVYDGPIPDGLDLREGGVLVSVLVKDVASRDDLRAAGLKVLEVSKASNLIIGVAPLGRVDDIALITGVRRIEPTTN